MNPIVGGACAKTFTLCGCEVQDAAILLEVGLAGEVAGDGDDGGCLEES